MDESPPLFEAAGRKLCPDGSCLGLIGPEGRCNLCGARGEPGTIPRDDLRSVDDPGETGATLGSGELAGEVVTADFDPKRRLCDDGACTGIVGADGACGVCGRRAAGAS